MFSLLHVHLTGTFNIWGKDGLDDGTQLYFILYPAQISGSMQETSHFRPSLDLEPTAHGGSVTATLDTYCWQWRPYANRDYFHPTQDPNLYNKLGLKDKVEKQALVKCVYVGRISSKGYRASFGSVAHTEEAITNIDRHVTLPMMVR